MIPGIQTEIWCLRVKLERRRQVWKMEKGARTKPEIPADTA